MKAAWAACDAGLIVPQGYPSLQAAIVPVSWADLMFDLMAAPDLRVFSIMAAFVVMLLVLEFILMLIGLSSDIGLGGMETPDVEAGLVAPDIVLAEIGEIDAADVADIASDALAAAPAAELGGFGSVAGALGLGKVPLLIWLAMIAAFTSATGLFVQLGLNAIFGVVLPGLVALVPAVLTGFYFTRKTSGFIAAILPQVESYGISEMSFNRRRGVVTVGTARRGSPAQVRFNDSFGTTHYLMAEPLEAAGQIDAGTEVLILRNREGQPRLVAIS